MEIMNTMPNLTHDSQCYYCGRKTRIPIQERYDSPIYWMQLEKELKYYRELTNQLVDDITILGQECVAAGFKPSFVKRMDDVMKKLSELKQRMNRSSKNG